MHSEQLDPPSIRDPVVLAAFGVLIAASVLGNRIAPGAYVLWAILGATTLALLARVDGLSPAQWGLGRVRRRQAVAAVVALSVGVAGMVAAWRVPAFSEAFADERVAGLDVGQVAYLMLLRVPFGTVLLEEVAFRGVLLALLARRIGARGAVAVSCLAFGVWHVLPILAIAPGNAASASVFASSPVATVVVGALASTVVGALFCWLRLRYDHLLVPMALHAAVNASAYGWAWVAATG